MLSVSHALKAASFAVEPKKVITQSNTITSVMPIAAAFDTSCAAAGKSPEIQSVRRTAKKRIETPQRMYPKVINALRLPIRSESAPINSVVSVAATALACTISAISPGAA